jgi:alkanesulfonate monooxygenase SsuD/methylene tetrahydromethanopterin reductase-like flavin-dependent oxidoreductase (luciferase family)
MKFGLQVNRFDYPGGTEKISDSLKSIAEGAEAADFYSLFVMDHFFQIHWISGDYTDPMLEAYTTLGFLAGVTRKVKLGALVTGVIYREPALLVKAVTALDVLSNSRAYLGIGAGWYEEEARALGFLLPLESSRFERLEEALQIAKKMWSSQAKPFHGQFYHLEETLNSPRPISRPTLRF